MLNDSDTYTTISVSDLERAKQFYGETLGLTPVMVTEGGVMYQSGGTQFFVYPSTYKASGHTQMSWVVGDIKAEVAGGVDGIFPRPRRKPARPDADRLGVGRGAYPWASQAAIRSALWVTCSR
jgi:catechol 2,3-dioxygenase-like lactoylglutathione lyase family enzyme